MKNVIKPNYHHKQDPKDNLMVCLKNLGYKEEIIALKF